MGTSFSQTAASSHAGGGGGGAALQQHQQGGFSNSSTPLSRGDGGVSNYSIQLSEGDGSEGTNRVRFKDLPSGLFSTEEENPIQSLANTVEEFGINWPVVDSQTDLVILQLTSMLLSSRLIESSSSGSTLGLLSMSSTTSMDDLLAASPAELYVSAPLRLAAIQLQRSGIENLVEAITYLAAGGETREERSLRKSMSSGGMMELNCSSPEIHHFQRGPGFTGTNGSGSTLVSMNSGGSGLVGHRFSHTPLPPPLGTGNRSGSNFQMDHHPHSPSRGHRSSLPHGVMSVDEITSLPYATHGGGGGGDWSHPSGGGVLHSCRPDDEPSFEEQSYNNGLLTSMSARSTHGMLLRTGTSNDYSSSSTTLLSTTGLLRGSQGDGGSGGRFLSAPCSMSGYPWAIPPPPGGAAVAVALGHCTSSYSRRTSNNSSAYHGACSTGSSFSRALSPNSAVMNPPGVPNRSVLEYRRSSSNEATMTNLPYFLPAAVALGSDGCVQSPGGAWRRGLGRHHSGAGVKTNAPMPPPPPLPPPEAILHALCNVFLHLHLTPDDVENFITLLAVAALSVQLEVTLQQPCGAAMSATSPIAASTALATVSVSNVRSIVHRCLSFRFLSTYTSCYHTFQDAAGVHDDVLRTPSPPAPPNSQASAFGTAPRHPLLHSTLGLAPPNDLCHRISAVHHFFQERCPLETTSALLHCSGQRGRIDGQSHPANVQRAHQGGGRSSGTAAQVPLMVPATHLSLPPYVGPKQRGTSTSTPAVPIESTVDCSSTASMTHSSNPTGAPAVTQSLRQDDMRRANQMLFPMEAAYVLHCAEAIVSPPLKAGESTGSHPPPHESNGDGDVVGVLNPDAVVWELRTRLLVLRHQYAYVYSAAASTMGLLHEEALYDRAAAKACDATAMHPHTPIALMDLSKTSGKSDFQVISGAGDVEMVILQPSKGRRRRLKEMGSSTSPKQQPRLSAPGSTRQGRVNILELCCEASHATDDEAYRVRNSTGAVFLLATPPSVESTPAALSTAKDAVDGGDSGSGISPSFERHRLVRPVVLSLASPSVARAAEAGSPAATATAGEGHVGNMEVLSLDLGVEPLRLTVYPLRLAYHGMLHHFFFSNPSSRDHWYQRFLAQSWMMQSPSYLDRVAADPHDVQLFLRHRLSFPSGPAAFECLDLLGAGTFGRVLLVQHKLSKRLFAMKVIRKTGFHGIRNIIEARREKKLLEMIDCPYIMKIHSSFQTDSRVYLLFDYLPGGEMLVHTQSAVGHHFSEATARFYIAELAVAVEYLRTRGIIHRDIKGDNLVLDGEGHVILTDFGFAKNILADPGDAATSPPSSSAIRRQHTSCGTLAYIAPEVLYNARRRQGYGLAVDWWSMGVVLFTFLTGFFPFLKGSGAETSHAIVNTPLQYPSKPPLSSAARDLLQQLLQKDPANRITSLAQLRQHPFFDGFDWVACMERRLSPPLVLHKDSYKTPKSLIDAHQQLQDRVRRWQASRSTASSGEGLQRPFLPPPHSRRSSGDPLAATYKALLEEEREELAFVEGAYGHVSLPRPTSAANDVFGPLFAQQERCGSDREDSDVEDAQASEYINDAILATAEERKKSIEGLAHEGEKQPTISAFIPPLVPLFSNIFDTASPTSCDGPADYKNPSHAVYRTSCRRACAALAPPPLFNESAYLSYVLPRQAPEI